ncbi:MarR family winged helix-turn-helix transcriptional regulator [Nonomuraea sp. NBC_01738]|uniref:MarR family winged helix-turn-helix transcriptional regulator n=1 Tax=Nonomuraea sp. NBC_01738 TaxID=2976003 RepID=UPI002E10E3CF|nr:MarR family winged helix-turn-helix transcriptional regulator [Nonomuraea sp. NBC_01738]
MDRELAVTVAAFRSVVSTLKRAKTHDLMATVAGMRIDQPEAQVLIHLLDSGDPRRVGAIAQALQVESPHVTRTVAKLERQGLVERVRDPDDGRAWRIGLTGQGGDVAQVCMRVNMELFETAMAGWVPQDRAELTRLLGRLSEDMLGILEARLDAPAGQRP